MPEVFAPARPGASKARERITATCRTSNSPSSSGKLYMLQTRSGKRTAARRRCKIAVDMAEEGLIDEVTRRLRHRSGRARPASAPDARPGRAEDDDHRPGLPASPGAAAGEIVLHRRPKPKSWPTRPAGKVILVRLETSPEDIHGMHAAAGILTARGGMTSHAAVVARGMGRACVSGAGKVRFDEAQRQDFRAPTGNWRKVTSSPSTAAPARCSSAASKPSSPKCRVISRQSHGMGRRDPPHGRSHQCRDAGRRPHRPSVSAPRASGCAGPNICSSTASASSPCAR